VAPAHFTDTGNEAILTKGLASIWAG